MAQRQPLDISQEYATASAKWAGKFTHNLPPLNQIKAELSPTMTNSFGWWRYSSSKGHRVYISQPWLMRIKATAGRDIAIQELRRALYHELAHVLMYENFKHQDIGHGAEFQRAMRLLGYPQDQTYHYRSPDSFIPGTNIRWAEAARAKV